MDDRERLAGYVDLWWSAIDSFTTLLESLAPADWPLPSDLPGWNVQAVAAHVAHLESVLAGAGEESADIGEPAHVTGLFGQYTEIGVVTRREWTPAEIIAEIRQRAAQRLHALRTDPPTDASARAPITPGGVPWSWERLLRNRMLDVWMHEQDIRRAIGRPGGMNSPAAQASADYFTEGFGFVVGKAVGAPPGTSAVLDVTGSPTVAVEVDAGGRAQNLAQPPAEPTVRLGMDRETYILRAGGRRAALPGAVTIEGDQDLGATILDRLTVTI
jgi:uncharacterized protein (TIGR03083 family)